MSLVFYQSTVSVTEPKIMYGDKYDITITTAIPELILN